MALATDGYLRDGEETSVGNASLVGEEVLCGQCKAGCCRDEEPASALVGKGGCQALSRRARNDKGADGL